MADRGLEGVYETPDDVSVWSIGASTRNAGPPVNCSLLRVLHDLVKTKGQRLRSS